MISANNQEAVDCVKSFSATLYHSGKKYCSAIWDGFVCWPPTEANTAVFKNCPAIHLIDTSNKAFRKCGSDGHWVGRHINDTNGWTNYTPCYPERVRVLLEKVYDENGTAVESKFKIAQRTRHLEIVGFSISLFALLISMLIYCRFRSLRNTRTKIHQSLFTAMILQVLIRLTVYIDQAVNRRVGDNLIHNDTRKGIDEMPYVCEMSYVFLEYTISVMFMWMFIEGLYLHNVVTANSLRQRLSHAIFCMIGWGIPVIFTVAWAIATAFLYNNDNIHTCWYGYNFTWRYWILQGPRFSAIMINLIFLLKILRVLIVKLQDSRTSELEKLRKAVRAALVLLPLLGITNLLNMLEAPLDAAVWKFALWCYTTHFLRSFQGFFIALIYCFMNGEVRSVIYKQYQTYKLLRMDRSRYRPPTPHDVYRLERSRRTTSLSMSTREVPEENSPSLWSCFPSLFRRSPRPRTPPPTYHLCETSVPMHDSTSQLQRINTLRMRLREVCQEIVDTPNPNNDPSWEFERRSSERYLRYLTLSEELEHCLREIYAEHRLREMNSHSARAMPQSYDREEEYFNQVLARDPEGNFELVNIGAGPVARDQATTTDTSRGYREYLV